MLHLWSLGVEEQFYIVWPVLLFILARRRSWLIPAVIILAIGSFALNVWQTFQNPVAAFFSPLPRFWELLLGAAVAIGFEAGSANGKVKFFRFGARSKHFASLSGIALLLAAVLIVREKDFPGWQVLLPVVGTVLLIWAGPNAHINKRALSMSWLVFVGKVSYPLYLWHWPVLTLARMQYQSPLPYGYAACLVLLSFLLACATYLFIERPIQSAPPTLPRMLPLMVAMAALAVLGGTAARNEGFTGRLVVARNQEMLSGADGGLPRSVQKCPFIGAEDEQLFTCLVDSREPPRFAIIGDSKAQAILPGLIRTSEPGGRWIFFGSTNTKQLKPVIDDIPYLAGYDRSISEKVLNLVADNPSIDTVLIGMAGRVIFNIFVSDSLEDMPSRPHKEQALEAFDRTIRFFRAHGKRVVLLIDNPTMPSREVCIPRRTAFAFLDELLPNRQPEGCNLSIAHHLAVTQQYREVIFEMQRRYPQDVLVFDPTMTLCDESTGLCPQVKDGRPIYGITDHISEFSSGLLGQQINEILGDRRGPPPPPDVFVAEDWGPHETKVGVGFNIQPDGASALWIRLKSPPQSMDLSISFGASGPESPADINGELVTTAVPQEIVETVGAHPIVLIDHSSGISWPIGTLTVSH